MSLFGPVIERKKYPYCGIIIIIIIILLPVQAPTVEYFDTTILLWDIVRL
jgi:hypothetical protein